MLALITTLLYVGGIIAAIDAVMTARTAQGAIAWAVTLVAMPVVALPAYLVFGRSKFAGMVDAYEARKDEIDALIDEIGRNLAPWNVPAEAQPRNFRAIEELAELRLTRRNRVDLLVNGEATFASILSGIAEARDYVLVQFYMIHDDGLGRRLHESLLERARSGVRVFVLYDEVGSKGLPGHYVDTLRDAGVKVSSFRPSQGRGNRFQLNFRNHRKMVVVDGVTGWIGGHNVGDEYLGLDPEFTPWRDTHVRLQGPVVTQLQAVILSDWYWATREIPEVDWQPRAAAGGVDMMAMIVPTAPTQRLEAAGLMFVSALTAAKRRIWLSAPYFVPDEAVMKALELAALRGVDVRVITTGKPDSLPVFLAAFHYIEQLRGLGIRFYAYQPGFLHEKVMLVDDDVATVGTANFDNRSFRLNFEVTALVADPSFAQAMEAMFADDFAHSVPIDATMFDEKPFWWRLGVNLSRLAAPVL